MFESEYTPTIEAEPVRHGRWIEKPPYADETVKGSCEKCIADYLNEYPF